MKGQAKMKISRRTGLPNTLSRRIMAAWHTRAAKTACLLASAAGWPTPSHRLLCFLCCSLAG
eukprot:scaffold225023_cov22-Tisochrysis_lutea.AAC.2